MMKRTIFLLVALIMVLTLCGCGTNKVSDEAAIEIANFKQIDGEEAIYYSENTKVIYYLISTSIYGLEEGYGYMAPYISENGKFCRYINDEIVEIIEEKTDN